MDSAHSGTRFCEAYGIRYPIASAGMAFVASTPELAIAVSRAGGMPAIGAGILTTEQLEACVAAYRSAATAPLNINFLTFDFDAAKLALCCALTPDIVSFHWGHPEKIWIDALHMAGIRVWEQVGSAKAAQTAFDDGVDLVIIQGLEAGGHNYAELPRDQAVAAIRKNLGPEPLLLAAGGISDGSDMAHVMSLGADGVMLGSRLVASNEANAHDIYKAALVASDGSDTVLTSVFGRGMPFFNPVRVIANECVRTWHGRDRELPPATDHFPEIGKITTPGGDLPIRQLDSIVPTRGAQGDIAAMMLLAGQGTGKIHSIESVADIILRMMAEARAITPQTKPETR
jgi:NAD(P)H-dependent flavin oxidoreductase YrpB (nitropropane dioxygenase family)